MALASDPGNLDPQMAAGSALFTLSQLAYDALLSVNAESGAIESQLATDWTVDGTKVTFTLADGVTCADGTELTATDAAARHLVGGRRHHGHVRDRLGHHLLGRHRVRRADGRRQHHVRR